MLSEKISAIPRVDNGGPPRQGGWQEKRPFGGGLRRSNLEGRRGWRAKLLRAGKKGLREAREYGYNFYSWVSLTREIICSEEIKTKMQSKWPAVTQGNPEVQIIPLRAFYSTWLSAHKVWHLRLWFCCQPGLRPAHLHGAGKSCALGGLRWPPPSPAVSSVSTGNWKDEPPGGQLSKIMVFWLWGIII